MNRQGHAEPGRGPTMPDASAFVLYGTRGSGSAAVEAALHLAGAPFRVVRASSWEADSAQDALARVNALRQIPTLQMPDGSILTESAAMLIHLGLAYPRSPLLPTDAAARAQSIRGLVYIAANCYSAISIIDYPERWTTDASTAALDALRQGTRARLHRHWEIFADSFAAADGAFLAGAAPGALDLLAAVVSKWSGTRAHLAAQRPDFSALLGRIETHPSVAPVFSAHWPS